LNPIVALWRPVLLLAFTAVVGCGQTAPQASQPPPPEVEVSPPLVREVSDYEEFTGRIDAEFSVEIRARVSGYLKEIRFKDGDTVREGQVLFEIDPRPYQAAVAKDQAALAQAEAHLSRLDQDFGRARQMLARRAMSREDYDKTVGDRTEAAAAVASAKAALDNSRLYLEWTQVRAPISGRVSRRLIDRGNMVTADQTSLTTVVSTDPMYVYFDVDERTLLRLRSEAQPAAVSASSYESSARVEMGLASEDGYSHQGVINFEDNRVDSSTGTIRMRGVFANPKTTSGVPLLSPGLFARVRLPLGLPHRAILVSDRALGADQGKKFLYVIKDKPDAQTGRAQQVVERRYVHLGRLHGGLREIKEAVDERALPTNEKLAANERVVVSGLQRVRQGAVVQAKDVKMPAHGPATAPLLRPTPRDHAPPARPAAGPNLTVQKR
jgi:RND family efflux transporter MFP subunit